MSDPQGEFARPDGRGPVAAGGEPRGEPGSPDAAWTTYIVDGGYPARMARAMASLNQADRVIAIGVAMGAIGLVLLTGDWVLGTSAAVAGLVLAVAMHLRRPVLIRRRLRALYPPGTVISARLMPDELWTSGPLGSSQLPYRTIQEIRVREDVVLLRRRPRDLVLAPVELLGPAGVAWLQRRIGSGAAR